MKILLLTQIVPYPPDSGPKVKTYHVLRYLAERGHQVTLASFVRAHEQAHLEKLRPYCAAIHAVPLRRSRAADVRDYLKSYRARQPFLVVRDALPAMQQLVARVTREQKFDIVHADQLTMAQFTAQADGARSVFDAHNAVWTIVARAQQSAPFFLKPVLAHEARQLKVYEGQLCRAMDAVLAVSSVDRGALVEAGARADNITIMPIAVDCRTLQPVRHVNGTGELNIITASTLFYPPNADGVRWFMHQVYPLVRQQVPSVTLTVAGPRPPKDIVEFGASQPDVNVTDYVPNLLPYLERAALMIVPVRAASGMRVRILEALAQGIPVVTTTTGVEGIDARDGEHLLIADEPAAFAQAVVRLLRDGDLRAQLSANGRRLIEEKYDWQVVLPRLENVYEGLRGQ